MKKAIEIYRREIKQIYKEGDYTELSFRNDFQKFLEEIFKKEGYKLKLLHEPSKKQEGSPDFRVLKGYNLAGYIETKSIDRDLAKLSKDEKKRLKKYIEASGNVILTNYRDFVLYQGKSKPLVVHLLDENFKVYDLKGFEELIQKFLSKTSPMIKTPEKLAKFLAKFTRILKDNILELIKEKNNKDLKGYYTLFKTYLLSTIKEKEFADAYAQTITYGLFMARLNLNREIGREDALLKGIPKSLELLSKLYYYIAGDLPKELEWVIDDIINILNGSDWDSIVRSFKKGKGRKDPFMHFYETFLASYDPNLRKSRGVYYTPPQVVEFIVNSVNEILKDRFNSNLTDRKKVLILDPAIGTGTFLAQAIQRVYDEVGSDIFPDYVKEHILKNFYGFEILIAPYTISHLRLSLMLRELGVELPEEERFRIYLTNTLNLMRVSTKQTLLPIEDIMKKECNKADKIKTETPIFVIVGNPPYETKSEKVYIENLIKKDYLKGLGVEKERKKGVIQDDYVKFIRFAQWKIGEQTKKGIVAYITNNSYLDGLIHRRMRESLMETFDEIYILNLHGNKRKGEPDENIFDIQQGVAISIFIKYAEGKHEPENCNIYYYSTLEEGLKERIDKYKFLEDNNIKTIKWKKLNVIDLEEKFTKTRWYKNLKDKFKTERFRFYFFTPKAFENIEEYGNFYGLDEIFEVYGSGFVTGKDKILIQFEKEKLENIIKEILNKHKPIGKVIDAYKLEDTSAWKPSIRIKKARRKGFDETKIKKILYRPFDFRFVYYENELLQRSMYSIMKHLVLGDNLSLVIERIVPKEGVWDAVFVSDKITDVHLTGSKSYSIPLYLYKKNNLINELKKVPNIKKLFLNLLKQKYGDITPEDFLYYIYAVLYDPNYREKYQEFLKIDFPRIPLYDTEIFKKYKKIGKELTELHLMKKNIKPDPRIIVGKDRKIEFVIYKNGKAYITDNTYFEIPQEVWEYKVGRYNVLEKYLKYRKGRELTLDEIEHISRIVEIIKRTLKLTEALEKISPLK